MNLRKSNLAEELLDNLNIIELEENALILVYLPNGLPNTTVNNIGQSIQNAINAMGRKNPILLVPNDIRIEQVSPEDMKELGYTYAKPTKRDSLDNRLQGDKESSKESKDKLQEHTVRRNKDANNWRVIKEEFKEWINSFKRSTSKD